ncbi:hypothetical protein [Pendulispora albinea]|uniref:Uncharacterized protein n=1 Tax=Pendulispora albinea TaxID=2741071 RepID=A0ABZ2LW22_9BACT
MARIAQGLSWCLLLASIGCTVPGCKSLRKSYNESFCREFRKSFLQSCTSACTAKPGQSTVCATRCGEALPREKAYSDKCDDTST